MYKLWILIFFILFRSYSHAQIDYHKINSKKIVPTRFDTSNVDILILDNKYAKIYFKQTDLKAYIESGNKREIFNDLYSLLNKGKEKITLKDYWHTYTERDRRELFGDIRYISSEKKYVDDLHFIGADLIHDGKFMLYNKSNSEFTYKGLKIKKSKGIMGGETLYFRLPDGQSFWTVLLSLGE